MAKIRMRKNTGRNIAAIGIVGSMAFCLPDPEHGILVVPSGFVVEDGNGWG